MYYIIQENIFKETNFNILIDILERHKLEYEIVKWRPFADSIELSTDRKDIVCFGGVSLTKMAMKYGWTPGVFFNDLHDMEEYMKVYKEHMLNSNGFFIDGSDELPESIGEYFFARPTKDSKLFNGGLFSREGWNRDMKGKVDARIFVSPEKHYINKEIRCWVVDGKVITISQYRSGKRTIQQNYDHEQEAIDFAQKMVDLHSPSRAFVLDIALYEDEYKIVEINCINSAGFYDANMSKLIQAIETMKY